MEKRINTRIFRNKNEVDIVQLLVREWQQISQVLAAGFQLEVDPIVGLASYPQRYAGPQDVRAMPADRSTAHSLALA